MALIECRDCQKELSTHAYYCPHCGGLAKWGYLAGSSVGFMVGLVTLAAVKYLFTG